MLKSALWDMSPKNVKSPACQEVVWEGKDVDLTRLPIQTCWPGDVAPLLTWGLVITRGPNAKRQNLASTASNCWGRTSSSCAGCRTAAARWISATTRSPIPARPSPSPWRWAPTRPPRWARSRRCRTACPVPAWPVARRRWALSVAGLLVRLLPPSLPRLCGGSDGLRIPSNPPGKPPDEPAVLGVALNEVFVPLLRRQQPEIVDFYLPPEGCSYRLAVVSIRKQYAGHAKRVMFGLWSILRQFMYTKFIVVVDEDIDPRDWKEVVWAMTTRMDPVRDTLLVENTPIDYLTSPRPSPAWAARWV